MEEVIRIEDISKKALEIIEKASKIALKGALVIAFYGDLGVGKTTLTKEIAKHLGIKDNVISPTFVLMKIYKTKNEIFKKLIHIDAYRLDKSEEINKLGWEDLVEDKNNFIIVEWPERVEEFLPQDTFRIDIKHEDDTTRRIKFI